jgi:ATP-dependent DNA ligase
MAGLGVQKVLHLYKEKEKKKPNISGNYMVSEKIDGIYVYIDRIAGKWGPIISRQGRPIPAFEHHTKQFEKLDNLPPTDIRLIAEAYIPGVDFHTANGIFNRSVGDYRCDSVVFAVHDMVYHGFPNKTAEERYERAGEIDYTASTDYVQHHPLLAISSDEETWLNIAETVWDNDGEGIVLKRTDSIYQPDKRNSSLMKIKLEENFVLTCIDAYYTVGEKGNSNLNAIFRREKGTLITCRVGKHSDIAAYEGNKGHLIGQKCLIVGMCELPDGAIREPRFKYVVKDIKNFKLKHKV